MPLYEYMCKKDGRFELIRKFSDPPVKACPTCGKPVEKLMSSPAIQFKGTGWYITDYARKGKKDGSSKESGDSSKDSGKSESAASADSSSKSGSAKSDSSAKSEGSSASKASSTTTASGGSSSK